MELMEEKRTKQASVLAAQRLFENERSAHLGIEDARRAGCGLEHQWAVVEHARGVEDAVDLAELLARLGDGGLHLAEVRHVGLSDKHSAGEGTDLNELANALFFGFGPAGIAQSGFPLRCRRQCGAADEHEASLKLAR